MNSLTKFALGIMGILMTSAFLGTPAFAAADISLSGTNTGSSTGGGITETGSSTGAHTSVVMGGATFTYTGLSPRSFLKVAAGADNFLVPLTGVGTNTICLDLTLTAPPGMTDGVPTVVSCSGTLGDGQYTFNIPSTHGGSVTAADTVTMTVKCDASSSIACSSISLGWGGAISSQNLQVQIPEGSVTTTPTLTTTLSATTIATGGSVSDTATLAGGASPTGNIKFFVSTTNTCPNAAATQVGAAVTVAGNGAYTSASMTFPTAGTFYWYAAYSGDSNNVGVVSACEPLTVTGHGAPEFPAGMLVVIGLALPALILLRRYGGIESPTI